MSAAAARYDLLVLGAGSAGLATAIRAARHGARVAIIEPDMIGGTCVNLGCVPKKAMWFAAEMADMQPVINDAGFERSPGRIDWEQYIARRNAYIERIHAAYRHYLAEFKIDWISGAARFAGPATLEVAGDTLGAPHIVISTGARPRRPDILGAELGIDSNGFFALRAAPPRIAVIGGGYIAAELSNVLHALGSAVTMLVRGEHLLPEFDSEMSDALLADMRERGIEVHTGVDVTAAVRDGAKYRLERKSGAALGNFDEILWAIGRTPVTADLALQRAGIACDDAGHVLVDEWQNTNAHGIYAIGDVTPNLALTPVAVATGRHLADRLFGGKPHAKVDFDYVPTVIFSHPPLASVGLSEAQARKRYGATLKIYRRNFLPMLYGLVGKPQRSHFKMICQGADEKVVGLHLLGLNAEEVMQGFAVAVKMGARKTDIDETVPLHPTSAEEVLLMSDYTT